MKYGKPRPPRFTRCFRLSITPEEAFETVLTTAEEHGWVEDGRCGEYNYSRSRKKLQGFNGGLAIPPDTQVANIT